MATATIRVSSVAIDPLRRDRVKRWLVTADVVEVHDGELSDPVLDLLVHSPARDFRDSDVAGKEFRVTLPDRPPRPYAGPFTLQHS